VRQSVEQQEHQQPAPQTAEQIKGAGANAHGEEK
jgi:hypothetical protein